MDKKVILFVFGVIFVPFFCTQTGWNYHQYFFRADDFTSGKIPNARMDYSSVTMRGDVPIELRDDSSVLGNIRSFNCVGDGINCSVADGTATITVSTTAGSVAVVSGISTFTWVLKSGGDVFLSTTAFIPIPGAFGAVGKSTINVFEVQSFTLLPSSVGWTSFAIARSTQGGAENPGVQQTTWAYITANSTVGVNSRYSVWTSTRFALYPGYSFSLHTTSVTAAPGALSAEYGMKIRGWVSSQGGD